MSRTKIAGWLLVGAAAAKLVSDLLDGNGFDFAGNFDAVAAALAGVGIVFLRDAVAKINPKK